MTRIPHVSFGRVVSGLVLGPLVGGLGAGAVAQSPATIPQVCGSLPGNAAVSLPLRWSQGTMQVRIAAGLLPVDLQGQTITGLRLRRPNFLFEPAYPAVQRTLTVRGGFQPEPPAALTSQLTQNRPTGVQVLFGPAAVAVAATPLPGPAAVTGQQLLQIVFTQPLPVAAGSLFLEFETNDPPLAVATTNWVDAVWFDGGIEAGYVVTVGDGGCTTRPEPTQLRWNDVVPPSVGAVAKFEVLGAPPTTPTTLGIVMTWMGIDPQTQPPGPSTLGFGAPFSIVDPGLVGCHQWAPLDVPWFGTTDGLGKYTTTFVLGGVPIGARIGVQAAWFDPSRPGIPMSFSNGLVMILNSTGVGSGASTAFFPANLAVSPWAPFHGQMPVIQLDY